MLYSCVSLPQVSMSLSFVFIERKNIKKPLGNDWIDFISTVRCSIPHPTQIPSHSTSIQRFVILTIIRDPCVRVQLFLSRCHHMGFHTAETRKPKGKDDLSSSLPAADKNKSRDEGMQKSDKYDIEKKIVRTPHKKKRAVAGRFFINPDDSKG